MLSSSCYKDFLKGRALWHQAMGYPDGAERAAAMIVLVTGTWKRYEGEDTTGVQNCFVTCDTHGLMTYHDRRDDVLENKVSVPIKYVKKTLYCFSQWRLVPTKSTDDRLVWKSQYSSASRRQMLAASGKSPPKVVIWIRVTAAPPCLVFTTRSGCKTTTQTFAPTQNATPTQNAKQCKTTPPTPMSLMLGQTTPPTPMSLMLGQNANCRLEV